jgi:hypothetical protein
MEKHRKKPGRRSAGEWASLVEAWTDSGLSAAEFGAKHGIEAARLKWWRWRLAASAQKRKLREPVKLVRLDVVADTPAASQWELHNAAGDTLRVSESITLEELAVILRAFGLRGRGR